MGKRQTLTWMMDGFSKQEKEHMGVGHVAHWMSHMQHFSALTHHVCNQVTRNVVYATRTVLYDYG